MASKELTDIALRLLDKYKDAQSDVIWEYSPFIDDDLEWLDQECNMWRELIEKYSNSNKK